MSTVTNRGFALVSAALLLALILAFGTVLVDYILAGRRAGKTVQEAINALQIAEAGMHKAIFCLNASSGGNCGGTYGSGYTGESNISFEGGSFTITVSGGGSSRAVTSEGKTRSGKKAKIGAEAASLPDTNGGGFGHALQGGTNGISMDNNADVNGDVYSSGDVTCQTTQAKVTGKVSVSKSSGKILSCRVTSDAKADQILTSKVNGNAHYKNDPTDIAGTTVDGTKYPGSATPPPAAEPTIGLDFWRNAAERGGLIEGNYLPADGSEIGPVKITGDLTISQNIDVTLKGPVWVLGNIRTENNSSIGLDTAYGAYSTVILADDPDNMTNRGKITIINNTSIVGSGNSKSHILFMSTNTSQSDTAPAIDVANNAAGAIFYAPNGTLTLRQNAGAKALAGGRLKMENNADVTYTANEFDDLRFGSTSPETWRIKAGTWREIK